MITYRKVFLDIFVLGLCLIALGLFPSSKDYLGLFMIGYGFKGIVNALISHSTTTKEVQHGDTRTTH